MIVSINSDEHLEIICTFKGLYNHRLLKIVAFLSKKKERQTNSYLSILVYIRRHYLQTPGTVKKGIHCLSAGAAANQRRYRSPLIKLFVSFFIHCSHFLRFRTVWLSARIRSTFYLCLPVFFSFLMELIWILDLLLCISPLNQVYAAKPLKHSYFLLFNSTKGNRANKKIKKKHRQHLLVHCGGYALAHLIHVYICVV